MELFFSHKDAYVVLALLVAGLAVALPFVAQFWFKARRAEMELSLKQAMVERGMSAGEICAVMEAGEASRRREEGEDSQVSGHQVRA